MQPAICDAVGSLESPAGKDRLHDLETVRDPADRSGDLGQAHPRCQLAFEAEHDFRLDPRLRQMHHADPVARYDRVYGRVVNVAPKRLEDAVLRPHVTVGEADLATDRRRAALHPQLPQPRGDSIGIAGREFRIGGGERFALAARAKHFEHRGGDTVRARRRHLDLQPIFWPVLAQSARKLSSPLSVSGCLTSAFNVAGGTVATSAPIKAACLT